MEQVWLVTGSSRGLARAIVEASLDAGNKVLATARNPESMKNVSQRYGEHAKASARTLPEVQAGSARGAWSIARRVSATAQFQRDYNGRQPGDPKKAAEAITKEQKPPLRLLLGSDAYYGAEKNDLARLDDARTWKGLSLSTDFAKD